MSTLGHTASDPRASARTSASGRTSGSGRTSATGRIAAGLRVVALRRKKDGVAVLELSGRADRGPADRAAIAEARRRLLAVSPRGLVVDATALTWLPLTTFGALVADAPRLAAAGGGVVFAGLQAPVVDHLWRGGWVANQHPLFTADATVDEAAATLLARPFDEARLDPRRLTVRAVAAPGQAARLDLAGALDASTATALHEALAAACDGGARRVVVDVAGVVDAELETVDLVAQHARALRARGGALVVAGASGVLAEVLRPYASDPALGLAPSLALAEARLAG